MLLWPGYLHCGVHVWLGSWPSVVEPQLLSVLHPSLHQLHNKKIKRFSLDYFAKNCSNKRLLSLLTQNFALSANIKYVVLCNQTTYKRRRFDNNRKQVDRNVTSGTCQCLKKHRRLLHSERNSILRDEATLNQIAKSSAPHGLCQTWWNTGPLFRLF